jgi:hypothetical protein
MAVIKKTLFPKNLDKYAVLVNDTQIDSKYFKITELSDTFTGGKNAFLIAGSEYLVPDTKIQIELKDSAGNVIYHEPGEGLISSSVNGESFISEYYEGVSKVVSVYVYPDTAYGPCTLTILGELSEYQDSNGATLPVPLDWENKYNIKWQKQIDVNPSLANTTKIRFYQRPAAKITELLSPLYRIENDLKVASNVTQSFADIKLSKLETFAGDVKRIKVFRTSLGDISDYDLIQDILVESKELLTTFGLSGSVVGQTGILTSETLKNYWKTGSLNAFLTSSRVEGGVRLTGSGYFTYSSSLDIKSSNTYELNLDAFYSSSTSSNLGIYLSYVSQSTTFTSSLATLVGTTPTKNLLDTVIPFRIDRDYPSASLYFSQSQGEWHLGNISLRLSQDTAFSPDEVSFVTTMPTVLGNETYNFKFEFYDVNNNYVPVEVTQSALFTGGNNNINGTLTLISSSASGSLADLNRVSSSISGTMTVYSSSASSSITVVSGSVNTLSGSVSSSISALSSSVSSSNVFILSSSLSKVQQLANGQYSGSFIGDTVIYSPTIGGQQGYISDLFKVGTSPSIYLDARQNPRKIFIGGVTDSGSYNNSNTSVYMDSTGKFSLKDKLTWDGNSLSIQGTLKIADGTGVASSTDLSTGLGGKISTGAAASDVNNNVTTISGGKIRTGLIQSNNFSGTGDGSGFATAGMSIDLTGGGISAKNFRITSGGDAFFNGAITATSLTLSAGVTVPNASVAGLGSLATKSSVSATTDVTGLGALATRNTVNATYIDSNSITTGLIAANTIVAGNIASLKFSGKDARFDTGSIAGWTIDGAGLYKETDNYILKLNASSTKISITKTNPVDSLDVVLLDASETIPQIVPSDTGYIDYSNDGSSIGTAYPATPFYYNTGFVLGDGSSNQYGTGVHGIIGLVYATEEIGIDPDTFPSILNVINSQAYSGNAYAKYSCILRVRRFPTGTDALNETNMNTTYGDRQVLVAQAEFGSTAGSVYENSKQVYGATIEAAGPGGINTDTGQANWYRVEIFQSWVGVIENAGESEFDSIVLRRPAGNIRVRFGRVGNGYSVFSPGGLQVYQGFRNYMNLSSPSGSTGVASNFCLIKGKSQIVGSLDVTSGFSAANKQFKIKHPVNENKWLYHTSIEAPRADLIYRGCIQLENGSGSCLIDSSSRMSDGTFESLTKNSQLFLQNETGFDRVKGNVMTGSINVISENINSNDVISWMVVAERRDEDILNSPLYDSKGNYKPERYTSEYLEVFKKEFFKNISGSI